MRRTRAWVALSLIVSVATVTGQARGDVPEVAAALRVVLAGNAIGAGRDHAGAVWADVREFYRHRDAAPVWSAQLSASPAAAAALQVLRSATAHGLNPNDYGESQLVKQLDSLDRSDTTAPDRPRQVADFDARLTAALLALGRDVAVGRTMPERLDRNWKARRKLPDLVGTFSRAADIGLQGWLDEVRPAHPEYAALQKALVDLRQQQADGGWPKVPSRTFKRDESHPSVIVLRQRLAAGGDLAGAAATSASPVYDADVEAAVRAFQEHHGVPATGIVAELTAAAMNVRVEERIKQVEVNLERWRWMPDDFGPRYLLVNIPYFHVLARENGRTVREFRVIVGKPSWKTPIFSAVMATVVFSPYWNIPDSIAAGETVPSVLRNPGYLEKNHIEIIRRTASGTTVVDPTLVDWKDKAALQQLAFRQRPGPDNALGHVKFLFPNPHNVYLHDTPADELFARQGRAFSHGCIRVDEAETMAQYVLRDDPDWDAPRILAAMNAGVEQAFPLKQTIPVHVVYFTAWVDDAGELRFEPDVYKYDARQGG